MQQLIPKTSQGPVQALGHLLGAHATLTRELSARLVEEHGLTMSEYEVLFLLSREPEHSMRRIDLSREVRLSPSGITRMLDRLEATGTSRTCVVRPAGKYTAVAMSSSPGRPPANTFSFISIVVKS